MRSRMQVSRCCCTSNTVTIGASYVTENPQSFQWWNSTSGELDPIVNGGQIAPKLIYSTLYRNASWASVTNVPVHTYTNVYYHLYTEATDYNGVPSATDTAQDYNLYIVQQFDTPSNFYNTALISGIARSSLLGPVAWNQSAVNWGVGAYRDTANTATHVNTVVNDASWDPVTSALILLFEPTTQYTGPLTGGNAPGRNFLTNPIFTATRVVLEY